MSAMSDIKKHQRINNILLGPLERPVLKWLAAHMPTWITPDVCTAIGVLGAFGVGISYILSIYNKNFLWLASIGFFLNWFGDSLDGTLARHRHIERPIFGFFVDHTTDAFSAMVIFLGLGLTPYVSFNVACLALIAYLLLCVLVFLRTCVVGEFKISYSYLGPTEIRAVAVLLNIAMYFGGVRTTSLIFGTIGEITFTPYDLVVALIALILLLFFLVTAIQEIARLAKENK
ncbi:MAG TPA: CDP-alcohol phosphatidyltransferase family protein [Anaerolineales bacterium]|nr:CDP-alcohol phosphatidyltransferase family protein [Anaerolineales bacterium]